MEANSHDDIRRLLKTFGVKADELILRHLSENPTVPALKIKLIIQDLTDYGGKTPSQPLHFEVEGEVHRPI